MQFIEKNKVAFIILALILLLIDVLLFINLINRESRKSTIKEETPADPQTQDKESEPSTPSFTPPAIEEDEIYTYTFEVHDYYDKPTGQKVRYTTTIPKNSKVETTESYLDIIGENFEFSINWAFDSGPFILYEKDQTHIYRIESSHTIPIYRITKQNDYVYFQYYRTDCSAIQSVEPIQACGSAAVGYSKIILEAGCKLSYKATEEENECDRIMKNFKAEEIE